MKKLLFGILAIVTLFALVACGEKKVEPAPQPSGDVVAPAEENTPVVVEPTSGEEEAAEQQGVGNTDEGMVVLVLEDYFKDAFSGEVEEVNVTDVKVYTQEEIDNDEAIKSHDIKEGDIVFSASYELKIAEGVEDMMKFTAGTGEIDGQWIKEKHNVGIARSGENGYTIDAFGTAF